MFVLFFPYHPTSLKVERQTSVAFSKITLTLKEVIQIKIVSFFCMTYLFLNLFQSSTNSVLHILDTCNVQC